MSEELPPFPDIGCEGDCAFERAGAGWQCRNENEHGRCQRYVHPGDDYFDELTAYYMPRLKAAEAEGSMKRATSLIHHNADEDTVPVPLPGGGYATLRVGTQFIDGVTVCTVSLIYDHDDPADRWVHYKFGSLPVKDALSDLAVRFKNGSLSLRGTPIDADIPKTRLDLDALPALKDKLKKTMWNLLDLDFLESVARVFQMPIQQGKYPPFDWQRQPLPEYRDAAYNALMRHVKAAYTEPGAMDDGDKGTGQSHWACAAANLMMLWYFDFTRKYRKGE